jgi:hypothetical protein
MWWFWLVLLIWGAAGASGFIVLLMEASDNGDDISSLGLFAFLFFAVIGPFVWLIVWRYDSIKKREARHK